MDLSDEQKAALREIFTTRPDSPCEDCGGFHLRSCPRVKRQAWVGQGMGAGARTEVEYWAEWDDSFVAYPEDVFDPEGGDYERDAAGEPSGDAA